MSNRINYKEIFEKKTENSAEMKIKQRIYNTAFWEGMQTGYVSNALKEGSDGSGGYLVPDEFDERIIKGLKKKTSFVSSARLSRPNTRTKSLV